MKMCSISVEPMPSTMRMPVASCQACATLAGSGSPAEMHASSDGSSTRSRSSARYMVGAVASRVTPCRRTVSTSGSIPGLAIGANEAPKRIGNSTSTPRPNVNAIGAVPVKTSSGDGERISRAKVSQIASTSRWKWTQPLGSPVVPEVKAIRATSSLAVATGSNAPVAGSRSKVRSSRTPWTSPARRASTSACETCALAITFESSPARSIGIVATAMPPASRTPNQLAIISGSLKPCRSTRLPAWSPCSSTSTRAMPSARARSSA